MTIVFDIPEGASMPSKDPPPGAMENPVFNHLSLEVETNDLAQTMALRWGAEHIGFGYFVLAKEVGEKVWKIIDSEGMTKDFLVKAFTELIRRMAEELE